MPSYAQYYQTLIPHMHVPPGSIHLHTHSPSVLTSLSRSRQQARSRSLRARSWCWTLFGRNHFPANSFTWKELLVGLTTCLFQHQPPPSPGERSHTDSITTCTRQQFTRNPSLLDHLRQLGIQTQTSQNKLSNGNQVLRCLFSELPEKQFP
jgi:hypothetical protein